MMNDSEKTVNNIYSEPLFPLSQGYSLSLSSQSSLSTQLTQTQEPISAKRDNVNKSGKNGTFEEDDEEPESDSDSEASDFHFELDSIVVRASKMSQDYCTTGCSKLDNAFNGGIPAFGITELYGEAGTGKTQLCLQLAITAQLPKACGGLDAGGIYYICTEDALPTKRLVELVQHFRSKYPTELPENPMNNMFIEHVTDAEALLECVDIKLGRLARVRSSPEQKIRLVILDSVAAIFRSEFEDLSQRTYDLRRLAQTLHEFSHDHKAAIVVCNQVSGSPTYEGNVASLGMVWKNLVTTRIRMSKSESMLRYFQDQYEKEFIYRHSATIFQLIDADASGQISSLEFNRMGVLFNFDSSAIKRIFNEFDISGDKNLDFAEFRLFTMACIDEARAQETREKVKAFTQYRARLLVALEPLLRRFARTDRLPRPREIEDVVNHVRHPFIPGKKDFRRHFKHSVIRENFEETRTDIRDYFKKVLGSVPCLFCCFGYLLCCYCCIEDPMVHVSDGKSCRMCKCKCRCLPCWGTFIRRFWTCCNCMFPCCHCCQIAEENDYHIARQKKNKLPNSTNVPAQLHTEEETTKCGILCKNKAILPPMDTSAQDESDSKVESQMGDHKNGPRKASYPAEMESEKDGWSLLPKKFSTEHRTDAKVLKQFPSRKLSKQKEQRRRSGSRSSRSSSSRKTPEENESERRKK